MTIKQIITDFNEMRSLPLFEIPVIDKRTGEETWLLFNLKIVKHSIVAQHEALNAKQERSKYIASVRRAIDKDFSLDENLQELAEDIDAAIIDSDFFELRYEG